MCKNLDVNEYSLLGTVGHSIWMQHGVHRGGGENGSGGISRRLYCRRINSIPAALEFKTLLSGCLPDTSVWMSP